MRSHPDILTDDRMKQPSSVTDLGQPPDLQVAITREREYLYVCGSSTFPFNPISPLG